MGHKQDRQAKDIGLAINFRVRREWIVKTRSCPENLSCRL